MEAPPQKSVSAASLEGTAPTSSSEDHEMDDTFCTISQDDFSDDAESIHGLIENEEKGEEDSISISPGVYCEDSNNSGFVNVHQGMSCQVSGLPQLAVLNTQSFDLFYNLWQHFRENGEAGRTKIRESITCAMQRYPIMFNDSIGRLVRDNSSLRIQLQDAQKLIRSTKEDAESREREVRESTGKALGIFARQKADEMKSLQSKLRKMSLQSQQAGSETAADKSGQISYTAENTTNAPMVSIFALEAAQKNINRLRRKLEESQKMHDSLKNDYSKQNGVVTRLKAENQDLVKVEFALIKQCNTLKNERDTARNEARASDVLHTAEIKSLQANVTEALQAAAPLELQVECCNRKVAELEKQTVELRRMLFKSQKMLEQKQLGS